MFSRLGFAFESRILTPLGKKEIIFARGSLSRDKLSEFKAKANEYFYGTITPKITDYNDKLFLELGFKRYDDHTIMINLSKSEEELWLQLEKKSVRWGVKTAEKNNLVFEEASKEDLKKIHELYSSTGEKGGLKTEPLEFLESVFAILVPANLARIFIVKNQEQIVAGALLLIDSDHTMLHLTGSNEEGYKLQAMPFLYWNLVKFSKSLGKKYFDIGGFDTEAKEGEKTFQINRFKENFGGQLWEQPIYATNSKYTLARSLIKKFRFIKKMYEKVK